VYSLPFALLLQLSPYLLGWKKEDKSILEEVFFPDKVLGSVYFSGDNLLACLLAFMDMITSTWMAY
jgi:hypothetical protein